MAFALLAPKPSSHPFQERQLSLKEPVKIGRAVAKAKSSGNNGIFDCKVLSRNHAVMWYENGKFMLQDTKSSNGTYVNSVRLSRGSEESEPTEIKSGDTLQFGVEVVENSKNVTHGCIIGMVTLFNEDGTEAASDHEDGPQGLMNLLTGADQNILPQELWQLAQFLQDALHREQMLENKLATLQRMIGNCHVASEDTFQGFIQEDKLLSRLETLENQLEIVTKEVISEDETIAEKINYQDERLQYESSAKETLQRILKEKIDVLQKCGDLERSLSNSDDECSYWKSVYDKAQESIQELFEKNKQGNVEIQSLKEELTNNMKNHENIEEEYAKKVDELKILLEEAEKRGSGAAVEVESLQAECDFTKKQLQAMKERYELLQEKCVADGSSDNGDMDRSGHDLPFASENATLEKDVKNKSAYIQTLKVQLADVMSELERERAEVQQLNDKNQEFALSSDLQSFQLMTEMQDKLLITKDILQNLTKSFNTDEIVNLTTSSSYVFVDFSVAQDLCNIDQTELLRKAFSSCNDFIDTLNGDLQNINMVSSLQDRDCGYGSLATLDVLQDALEEIDTTDNNKQILTHESNMVKVVQERKDDDLVPLPRQVAVVCSSPDSSADGMLVESDINQALDAYLTGNISDEKFKEYIESEQSNKPTISNLCLHVAKELSKRIQSDLTLAVSDSQEERLQTEELRKENDSLKKQIESLSTEDEKCDRKLQAEEMRKENASLKKQVESLSIENENLKTEFANWSVGVKNENEMSLLESQSTYTPSVVTESVMTASVVTESFTEPSDDGWRASELQDELEHANRSIQELKAKQAEQSEYQLLKQNQLVNLVVMFFLIMVLLGACVMLGVLKISSGSLPFHIETTWTDIMEFLW